MTDRIEITATNKHIDDMVDSMRLSKLITLTEPTLTLSTSIDPNVKTAENAAASSNGVKARGEATK